MKTPGFAGGWLLGRRLLISEQWMSSTARASLRRQFDENGFACAGEFLNRGYAYQVASGISEITHRNLWYQALCGDPSSLDETLGSDTKESHARHFSYRYDHFPLWNVKLNDFVGAGHFTTRKDFRNGMGEEKKSAFAKVMANPRLELSIENSLHKLADLIGSELFLKFVKDVTDYKLDDSYTTACLSRFRAGHFLSLHSDGDDTPGVYAFVLQLTHFWLPHWGGSLVLINEKNSQDPSHVFLPNYNSLVLFAVPRMHLVTTVSSECTKSRYACTGWIYPEGIR